MGEEIDPLRAAFDDKLADLRDASADLLCHIADKIDDGRFRAAAAILRGKKPGRHSVDDAKALEYAASLLRTGIARSVHQACERSAKLHASPFRVNSMRDRLRRKFGRNYLTTEK